MPYIMGNIPYQRGYIRKEYLHDRQRGHGEFVEAVAYGVRCVRASSLWLQCFLGEPYGGAHYLLPLVAFVWQPCAHPVENSAVQPWDCFGSDFGVVELDFIKRGAAFVLPDRVPAQYRFTIDFAHTDLADDMEQHKHLHIVAIDGGLMGAFPNNRLLMPDPAWWPAMASDMRPDLTSLNGAWRSEGNEHLFHNGGHSEPNGKHYANGAAVRAATERAAKAAAAHPAFRGGAEDGAR